MKHSLSCDCPNCYEKQLQADRFLLLIGCSALGLVASAGYYSLIRASLFGWLKF